MEPRLNIVTLGVRDLERAVSFYEDGLGWPLSSISAGDYAIFKISTAAALALFPRRLLAEDACVEDLGGFGRITLAQNVSSREEVDGALSQAVSACGTLLKRASETDWGGYSGHFADRDGHPWEVAYDPLFELRQGKLVLPD